ncbi:MAG: hypothetical protein ACYSSI_12755, partial [Planctomycetota bacterium]
MMRFRKVLLYFKIIYVSIFLLHAIAYALPIRQENNAALRSNSLTDELHKKQDQKRLLEGLTAIKAFKAIDRLKTEDLKDEDIKLIKEEIPLRKIGDLFFSKILLNESPQSHSFKEFRDSVAKIEAISSLVEKIGESYDTLEGQSISKDQFKDTVWSYIGVIYRWIPTPLFRRFYRDTTFVPGHGLSHALDVLERCFEIINRDPEISLEDIDLE